ncbi:hypothetical protein PENVUL_c014G08674 [Penicillium vulpinum]|uniref:Zn(2)-C6 fungal-type domain-containing protein n=1 Tax=Penicillium vulpinum TaxID=29845 RepID=A0A1V6RZN2_9EURO|nr:hypothetical protein PENVUL_c014G08674 [Penicillium vulpinum]
MQTQSMSFRKRPVTACTECRRRKQKCDRERPCNHCVGRNVPTMCNYDYPSPGREVTLGGHIPVLQTPPASTIDDQSSVLGTDYRLRDQIGYAYTGDGNYLSKLQEEQMVEGDRGIQAIKFQRSIPLPETARQELCDICAKLPPRLVMRELIDIYFTEANWYFAVLEQYYFEKLYNSWCSLNDYSTEHGQAPDLPPDLLHFPALLFHVFAVSLQFLSPETNCSRALGVDSFTARDHLSSKYSTSGVDIARIMGALDPTITAVQNDLMRALWLKNCSRGREAWHALGSAIRKAQDLGLHQQSKVYQTPRSTLEETLTELWYDEYKRRLWIKLFSWDSHMAFSLGRPRSINVSDCTINPPLDCDIPADPSTRIPMTLAPHEPPSSFTPHIFQYAICQQAHEVMSLGAHKKNFIDYALIQGVHDKIISLLNNLPPVHRPINPDTSWDASYPNISKQRQQISTAANSFLMALHRPHAKTHAASRHAATQAALATLDAQEQLFHLMATSYSSIYALCIYTLEAGIFLSVTILEHPPADMDILHGILRAIRKAIHRLELAQERVSLAEPGSRILKACYQKIQASAQARPSWHGTAAYEANPFAAASFMSAPFSSGAQIEQSPDQRSEIFGYTSGPGISMSDDIPFDGTAMFEDITQPNFNMEAWVRELGQSDDLGWASLP